jgi:hypothetical protein
MVFTGCIHSLSRGKIHTLAHVRVKRQIQTKHGSRFDRVESIERCRKSGYIQTIHGLRTSAVIFRFHKERVLMRRPVNRAQPFQPSWSRQCILILFSCSWNFLPFFQQPAPDVLCAGLPCPAGPDHYKADSDAKPNHDFLKLDRSRVRAVLGRHKAACIRTEICVLTSGRLVLY